MIVKPDNGCGAEATYKLHNEAELLSFYRSRPSVPYIMEVFIDGTIVSFDGVADSHCTPRCSIPAIISPPPIMDIVNTQGDLAYWTQKEVPEALRDVGFRHNPGFRRKKPLLSL